MWVVSLYDLTGNMVRPWVEAGYKALIVDIQHPPGLIEREPGIWTLQADLRRGFVTPPPIDGLIAFVSAFPPCDHLAVSGARWFQGKGLRALSLSIDLFATAAEFCEASGAPYMIENPVSTISTYWRKPDHAFDPCDYTAFELGDNYTKRTCLWTGNGFVMPPANREADIGPPDNRILNASPGPDRKNVRSATPMGFARAVYLANRKEG